jgi:hypothetical protein
MREPVALFCTCGKSAEYAFETSGAADEFRARWRDEHRGEGHSRLTRDEWRREQSRLKRERKQAEKDGGGTGLLWGDE